MTSKTIHDIVDAYAKEHKYELARQEVEVGSGTINDQILIRATSFPDVPGNGPHSAAELFTIGQFHAHEATRDPAKGINVLVISILEALIARIVAGRTPAAVVPPQPLAPVPVQGETDAQHS